MDALHVVVNDQVVYLSMFPVRITLERQWSGVAMPLHVGHRQPQCLLSLLHLFWGHVHCPTTSELKYQLQINRLISHTGFIYKR